MTNGIMETKLWHLMVIVISSKQLFNLILELIIGLEFGRRLTDLCS